MLPTPLLLPRLFFLLLFCFIRTPVSFFRHNCLLQLSFHINVFTCNSHCNPIPCFFQRFSAKKKCFFRHCIKDKRFAFHHPETGGPMVKPHAKNKSCQRKAPERTLIPPKGHTKAENPGSCPEKEILQRLEKAVMRDQTAKYTHRIIGA